MTGNNSLATHPTPITTPFRIRYKTLGKRTSIQQKVILELLKEYSIGNIGIFIATITCYSNTLNSNQFTPHKIPTMRKSSTKNYSLLLFILLLPILITAQNQPWQVQHSQLNPTYFAKENSKPNPTSFDNMIGTSLGKEIGGAFHDEFHAKGTINSVRSFHLMEADFGDAYFPSEAALNAIDCDCEQLYSYDCKQKRDKKCVEGNPSSNYYGFHEYKVRYCAWKNKDHFKIRETYAAIEAQIPIKKSYCANYVDGVCVDSHPNPCLIEDERDSLPGRKFPDKWYTFEEWGVDIEAVETHAFNYAHSFATTFCPVDTAKDCVIQVLEIGNEPWGDNTPGKEGYHAILRGMVAAFKAIYGSDKSKWRMKLSAAAFDARFACHNAPKQYVQDMIPDDPEVKQYLDYLNIHNYPFINTPCGVEVENLKLAYSPESPDGGFMSLKNMDEWRRLNGMKHARINITEFGWNSDKEECNFGVGEANQAAYLMRANLIAARFNLHKVFNYQLKDQLKYQEDGKLLSPESPLYCTTGLIDRDGKKKASFYATQTFVQKLKGKHFLKALEEDYTEEGKVFAFLLGDYNTTTGESTPSHLVAWRADNLGFSNNDNIQYPKRDTEKGRNLTTLTLPSSAMEFHSQDTFFYLGWDNGQPALMGENIVVLGEMDKHQTKVDLSGLPIVIPIHAGSCTYNSDGVLEDCNSSATENSAAGTLVECGDIDISYGDNWIKLVGEESVKYHKIELIDITNWQYKLVGKCENDCDPLPTFSNLTKGDYILKVFNPDWTLACNLNFNNRIQITGNTTTETLNFCAVFGGDEDGDGICADEDCDDNNPNYPKTVGSPCDDGNNQTENDVIGEDGCTCTGETIDDETDNSNHQLPSITCGEVNISYGNGQIQLKGAAGKSYPFKIQLKQSPYTILSCHDCGDAKAFNNLPNGHYQIWVNYVSCGLIELKEVSIVNSCEDTDGDGICNPEDCAPNDINLPLPVDTPCNDGNENTIEDKIQADGCTCAGREIVENENNTTSLPCGEITIKYGNGTILITGLPDKSYQFSIHDMDDGWQQVASCWNNCGHTQKITNLAPHKYKVKVYGGEQTCNVDIQLGNTASSRSLSSNIFDLATTGSAKAIHLEWAAGGLEATDYFVIEKSLDSLHFQAIKTIGKTDHPYLFKERDTNPDYGINYYRIRQQFYSGAFRYSPIRKEAWYLEESSITLFPNPAQSTLNLSIGHFAKLEGEVMIFNRLGLSVATKKLTKEDASLQFDVANLPNGLYYLVIEAKNRKPIARQFMVENGL